MNFALGDSSTTTFDFGGVIGTVDSNTLEPVKSNPYENDPCWGDPGNWESKKGSDGKCYSVCKSNSKVNFLMKDASDCDFVMPDWMPWAIGGGGVLFLVLMLGGRR